MKRLVFTIEKDHDLKTLIEYCEAENISLRESDKTCGTFLFETEKKKNGPLKILSVEKIEDVDSKESDFESLMTNMLWEYSESSYTFGKAEGALAYYEAKGGNQWPYF